MSTKELIQAELDTLSDADLDALYALIKQFIQSRRPAEPRSLMATLWGIQIDAPPDFAANLISGLDARAPAHLTKAQS
jgi:hypothetical protein